MNGGSIDVDCLIVAKRLNKRSPCPCGSGKRYEQCCRRKVLAVKKAKKIFEEREAAQEKFTEHYGHIRVPQMIEAYGSTITAIGSTLYKQTRSGDYTFLHAIHDHALLFFGLPFLEEEEKKPLGARHPALQWMYTYVNHLTERTRNTLIGAGAAWVRFAYDLYTIKDNATLQAKLARRLVDPSSFQGARHELWVAALFIAANFEIDFEDEDDNTRKHPEFVAKDRETSALITVEAKSRHRKGVKGFAGGVPIPPGDRVDVRSLIIDAYQKETDKPLYVVVDLNLPPEDQEGDVERWLTEIYATMTDLASEGYADPCPANAIFFHNDPSHYMLTDEIGFEKDTVWIKDYVATNPRVPHPTGTDIRDRILKAHIQRVAPPLEIPEV